jgi:hypothetical protein
LANPELRARIGEAGRRRVLERWTWRRCAELTVEQYREVLAMPQNVDKLRRNGRLTVGARSVSRQANCDQSSRGSSAE